MLIVREIWRFVEQLQRDIVSMEQFQQAGFDTTDLMQHERPVFIGIVDIDLCFLDRWWWRGRG